MLRHLGVRSKLLALVAIPMAFLFTITGVVVVGEYRVAKRASNVRALTDVAAGLNEAGHRLQVERSATVDWQVDPSSVNLATLRGQRALVDTRLAALQSLVRTAGLSSFSSEVQTALFTATKGHGGLAAARHSIDARQYGVHDATQYFSRLISADLQLPGLIAQEAGNEDLGRALRSYEALATAIEQESAERDMLSVALTRGTLSLADYQVYAGLVSGQTERLRAFRQLASPEQNAALAKILVAADPSAIERFRGMAADLLNGRVVGSQVTALSWVQAIDTEVLPLTQLETRVVGDVITTAAGIESRQQRDALGLVGLLLLGLTLATWLTFVLSRRITRPLRGLTAAVTGIGEELPRMVERMQTPGEGPGVEFASIPVESNDEIGQLAVAFNSVNEVTVRVAREQAALRASIAEMFVNVARRNQVLLGRQLHFIDQMEAREENPDVLENLFRLDHLATRMRRNAESLLVLAGIDATRRLRWPLPLSDVIRTAVSEIETYERIDLAIAADPDVSGRFALTVAHLLAEVLENATHFSNPETRVVVATSAHQRGVELVITDYGLGMSAEELADANARIADPPVAEIAVAQRLGFYVVGRLAQRLGASVRVDRGRSAGTVVSLTLPNSVFAGITELETKPPAELRAVIGTDPAGAPVATEAPDEVEDRAPDRPLPVEPAVLDEVLDHVVAEEVASGDPEADEPVAVRPRGMRRLLPRRERRAPVEELASVEVTAEAEPELVPAAVVEPEAEPELVPAAVVEPEAEPELVPAAVVEPEPELEPVPVALVEPEPEPEPEPVRVALVEQEPEPEPVPVALVEPEPKPAPVTFSYVPAVDILPGAPASRRSRFARRHSAPAQQVEAAVETPTPDAEPEPAPVAAAPPVPVPALRTETPAPTEPSAGDQPAPTAPKAKALTAFHLRTAADEVPVVPAVPPRLVPVSASIATSSASVSGSLPTRQTSESLDQIESDARQHSDALSELRGLYAPSYTPPVVDALPLEATALTRRSPRAAEAEVAAPTTAAATTGAPIGRQRTAAEVRGMLAGFRSGVERGRSAPAEAEATDETTEDN